mmetsp:Transcript_80221/g.117577  ORF Transcript_80221/g.117577 Transcript_80221/m.117577 type:complete len:224 (-) Transcript_80221:1173-1844(-)
MPLLVPKEPTNPFHYSGSGAAGSWRKWRYPRRPQVAPATRSPWRADAAVRRRSLQPWLCRAVIHPSQGAFGKKVAVSSFRAPGTYSARSESFFSRVPAFAAPPCAFPLQTPHSHSPPSRARYPLTVPRHPCPLLMAVPAPGVQHPIRLAAPRHRHREASPHAHQAAQPLPPPPPPLLYSSCAFCSRSFLPHPAPRRCVSHVLGHQAPRRMPSAACPRSPAGAP